MVENYDQVISDPLGGVPYAITAKGVDVRPETDPEVRVSSVKLFLDRLYHNVRGDYYTYICEFNPYCRTTAFKVSDPEERLRIAELAIKINDEGSNVYFGVNLTDRPFQGSDRPSTEDIVAQVAVISDIDVTSNHHNSGGYVPDTETAISLLPFKPSLVVSSGGGIHAYNLFSTPLFLKTVEDRKMAKDRNEQYIAAIRDRAQDLGYKGVDGVGDLPRVLRLVGTINSREGTLCKVVQKNFVRYTPEDISEKLTVVPVTTNITAPKAKVNVANSGAVAPEVQEALGLAAVNHLLGRGLDYNTEWLPVMSALLELGREDLADELNRSDPRPDKYEDIEKVKARKLGNGDYGWSTIIGIAKQYGFDSTAEARNWFREHQESSNSSSGSDDSAPPKSPVVSVVTPDNLFGGDISDMDNARRILYYAKGDICYVPDSGQFGLFKKQEYTDSDTGEIQIGGKWVFGDTSIIKPLVGELVDHLVPLAETEQELAIVKSLKSNRRVKDAISMLTGIRQCFISAAEFDQHPTLLNCRNGVVDLETGLLIAATPDLKLTQQSPVVYNPDITNPGFDRFMEQILPDEDTRAAFLRYLGYCLTGLTREHKAMFIKGSGRNGKTTILNIINRLLGDYSTTYNISGLLETYKPKTGEEASPLKAKIVGKRFVMVNEIPRNRRLDMTEFKHMTGGDPFSYRQLHCPEMTCENPQHKFILGGNNLPELEDATDNALIQRLLVVDFPCYFGDNPDTGLFARLTTPQALTGILTTLVQQAQLYLKSDLYQSESMKSELKAYIDDNNIVSEYLQTFTEKSEDGRITTTDLYDRIHAEYGSRASWLTSKTMLNKQLRAMGYDIGRGKTGMVVLGVKFC